MKTIKFGNIFSGMRIRLNKVRETKAVFASRTLFASLNTNVVKLDRATKNGAEVQRKVLSEIL